MTKFGLLTLFACVTAACMSFAKQASSENEMKAACDSGNAKECNELGKIYMKTGNNSLAKQLFMKACDAKELKGCNNLGIFENAEGNKTEAKKLWGFACDGNVFQGCDSLAILENESGNKAEAKRLFKKGCDLGSMNGCNGLGVLEDEEGHITESARLWKKACDGNSMEACASLAGAAFHKGDKAAALTLFRKACDGGNLKSCTTVGTFENEKGNRKAALTIFQKACDGGEPLACGNLKLAEKNGEHATTGSSRSSAQENGKQTVIQTFEGDGVKNTRSFKVEGKWAVQWESAGDFFSASVKNLDNPVREIVPGQFDELVANHTGPGKGESFEPRGGEFMLKVNALGKWKVRIVNLE
jgi:TPR repeat protein